MAGCGSTATIFLTTVKRRVIVRPRAEADLREAKRYYDEQRPGLGEELLTRVREAIDYLEEHAERRPIYYRDFRRILTRRFPYKIFYTIEAERVIVFRVLHVKRDHPQRLDQ